MQCSKCHRDAIVFQTYSGMHLCGQHLVADVEAKAKKMIRTQGWLRPGDHIAVLLSGDPGSSALLYFLKHLTAQRRDIRISAITIADGTGYNSDISRAKRSAEALATEVFEVSFPEESGILTGKSTGKNRDMISLSLSTPSRQILLERTAQQHGITRVAWALCLDDVAGVVLGSVIRGDTDILVRGNSHNDTVLRICPFISVAAAEVNLYAELCGFHDEQSRRQEPEDGLHKDMVSMLDEYTNNHPATKYALLNLGENLAGPAAGIAGLILACEGYGKKHRECCNGRLIPYEVNDGAA